MLQALDRAAGLFVFAVLAAFFFAYLGRLALAGRARSERTDRAGGSALLGKTALEFGYWSMGPVGRGLAAAGLTPNMLSWTSLVLGAAAATSIAAGLFGIAYFTAAISGVLDTLDGMVARLTGLSSEAGEVLDATIDRYVEGLFCAGAALYFRDTPVLAAIALMALIGCFMVSYSTAKAEAMGVEPPKGMMRRQERAIYLTLGVGLTALLGPWLDGRLPRTGVALPLTVALAIVGGLSNVAAIRRMRLLAATLRARERATTRDPIEAPAEFAPHV